MTGIRTMMAVLTSVALAAVMLLTGASAAHAAQIGTQAFTTPGSFSWTAPGGADFVVIDAYGAEGGSYTDQYGNVWLGGAGGHVRAAFPVQPGTTYQLFVGGRGGNAVENTRGCAAPAAPGGYDGGGTGGAGMGGYWPGCRPGAGGGGESAVLSGGNTLADRIVAAAGGGGAADASRGGDGGGAAGAPGLLGDFVMTTGGGTQTAGGNPGWDYSSNKSGQDEGATSGLSGNGGIGGSTGVYDASAGGGGGGGGWFGGGGGAAHNSGGGGSSWAVATAFGVHDDAAVNRGDGRVTVTWGAYQAPAIATASLPNTKAGQAYTTQIAMTGFPAPDAVLVGGSVLPPGLDLAGDGTISGTPTTAGTWTITIGATNAYAFAQQTYTMTVAAGDATSLQASAPMTTVAGSPYPAPVTAKVTDAYGNPESGIPITFTLPTSAPSGIFQASGVSAISVPTGADGIADAGVVLAGAFPGSYDVVVSNPGLGTTTVALTATAGPPIFLERALPPGGITEPYGHVIAITGSATVRLVGGALPAGLTLSRTGTLSGTPTAVGKYAFTVRATNANGVRKGRLTLAVLPPPKLSVLDASFLEGPFNQEHGYSVNLHLSRPSTLSVTVAYRTQDGTATAGSDYRAASGIATFAPGETDAFATIAVIGDDVPEPDETLTIRLSSPQHATIARTTATLTLLNDD